MKYTSVLIVDHEALRDLMKIMKSARMAPAKKAKAYVDFCDLLQSHTTAEEKSLYFYRKENDWLRPDIMEGLQEHRIAEELIVKINRTSNKELREAKIKVLCDYTKHHLDEEEDELFPHFEKTVSKTQSRFQIEEYLKLREKTQKHPTKTSRGALNLI